MLTDAQVQTHADRIRSDGFTVIEAAVNPELVEGLINALQRIEREHHLGPARTSFEGFKTVRINNLLTYDDLFWEVPLHDNVLPVVERVLGALRPHLAQRFELVPDGAWAFTWVVDFPAYHFDADERRWVAEHHGVIFVVRSCAVEYLKPARFNDELRVTVELIKVGAGQIDLVQRVLRGDELLAMATVKVACVGLRTMRPTRIPQPLATRIRTGN